MDALRKLRPKRTRLQSGTVRYRRYLPVIIPVYPHTEPVWLIVIKFIVIPYGQPDVVKPVLRYFHVVHKIPIGKVRDKRKAFHPPVAVIKIDRLLDDGNGSHIIDNGRISTFQGNALFGIGHVVYYFLRNGIILAENELFGYGNIVGVNETVPVKIGKGKFFRSIFHPLVRVRDELHYQVKVAVIHKEVAVDVGPQVYARVIKEYGDVAGIYFAVTVKVGVFKRFAFDADPEEFRKVAPDPSGLFGADYAISSRSVKSVQQLHRFVQVVLVDHSVRRGVLVGGRIVLPHQVDLHYLTGIDLPDLVKHGQYRFQAGKVIPVNVIILVHVRVREILDNYVQKLNVLLVNNAVAVVIDVPFHLFLKHRIVLYGGPDAPYQELRFGQAFDALQVPYVDNAVRVYVQIAVEMFKHP